MAQRTNPEMVLNFSVLRTSLLRGLSRERLMATLSGFYGALAAVLAMGADKASILRMILREAMALPGAGLAIGVVLVLAAGGLTQAMLYGIKANDAVSLAPAVAAV